MLCLFKKLEDKVKKKRRLCQLTLVMLCSHFCLPGDLVMQGLF